MGLFSKENKSKTSGKKYIGNLNIFNLKSPFFILSLL